MSMHQVSGGMGVVFRTPSGTPACWGAGLPAIVEKPF